MVRKDPCSRNKITNFRPITLLNVEFKILAKRLALVADRLDGEAQTCVFPGRTVQDKLLLIRYTIERVEKETRKGKAFDRVDPHYLDAVPGAAGFGLGFRS